MSDEARGSPDRNGDLARALPENGLAMFSLPDFPKSGNFDAEAWGLESAIQRENAVCRAVPYIARSGTARIPIRTENGP